MSEPIVYVLDWENRMDGSHELVGVFATPEAAMKAAQEGGVFEWAEEVIDTTDAPDDFEYLGYWWSQDNKDPDVEHSITGYRLEGVK